MKQMCNTNVYYFFSPFTLATHAHTKIIFLNEYIILAFTWLIYILKRKTNFFFARSKAKWSKKKNSVRFISKYGEKTEIVMSSEDKFKMWKEENQNCLRVLI